MYERVSVISAFKDSPTQWQIYSTVPKDGRQIFTDIAVLDDMVVAAGHGLSNTHCITRAYHKTKDFPTAPFVNNLFDSIYTIGYTPMEEVLTANVGGNVMALAQLNVKPSLILHVLKFDNTTGLPSQFTPSRATDIHGCNITTCLWKLSGLRYSSVNNSLHILEHGMLPRDVTESSLLWTFPLIYGGESTSYVQKLTGLTQTSLDVDIANHPVTSGSVDMTGMLDIHTFTPGGTFWPLPSIPIIPGFDIYDHCSYNTEDLISTPSIVIKQSGVDQLDVSKLFDNVTFLPDLHEIMFNYICE